MTTYLIFPVFINTKVLSNIQEHRVLQFAQNVSENLYTTNFCKINLILLYILQNAFIGKIFTCYPCSCVCW